MARIPNQVFVRIEFSKSSRAFLDSLSELMAAIEHSDQAMLEDSISEAHARLALVLRDHESLGFELGE